MANNNEVYGIAIAQFLLAILITVINTLMVAVLITTTKLRKDVTHCLLSNMWFVNLLLGVIVIISTVIENNQMVSLEKPKGTVVIVNCMVTIATFLALIFSRYRAVHRKNPMSLRTAVIIISLIWTFVLCLTFIKAIVSNLNQYNNSANMEAYRNFEIAILMLMALFAIIFFVFVLCRNILVARKKKKPESHDEQNHEKHDSHENKEVDFKDRYETRVTITIGIMLIVFVLVMMTYVIMQAVWVNRLYHGFAKDAPFDITASEIVIFVFYLHCLINPMILWCRDGEARQAMRKTMTCKSGNGPDTTGATMEIQLINNPQHQQLAVIQEHPMPPAVTPYNYGRPVVNDEPSSLPPLHGNRQFSGGRDRATAPPVVLDHDRELFAHVDMPNSRPQSTKFTGQNVGFVDNGELVHHM